MVLINYRTSSAAYETLVCIRCNAHGNDVGQQSPPSPLHSQAPKAEADAGSAIAELLANLAASGMEDGDGAVDDATLQADMAALQEVLRSSEGGEIDVGALAAAANAAARGEGSDAGMLGTDGKEAAEYDDAARGEYDDDGYDDEDDEGDGLAHDGAYDDRAGEYAGEGGYGGFDDVDETPLVEMPAGLWPYEVWQQTHAAAAAASSGGARALQPRKLSEKQWDNLVTRLNESSKRKQQALAAIQARREADELAGSRFTPAISRRSKKIARDNLRLPERMRTLMDRRQRRQDKLREEAQQREMSEATFKPKLSRPINGRMAHLMKRMNRRVGHLLQYDVDKQIRARQRQQLMQEIEARELTFSPRINAKSVQIFNRQRKRFETIQRKLDAGLELTEEESRIRDGGLTKAAQQRCEADRVQHKLIEEEMKVKAGESSRLNLAKIRVSRLPGHEEERFHPHINRRSRLLVPSGGQVHERLYTKFTKSHQEKTRARQEKAQKTLRMARTKSSAAFGMGNSAAGLSLGTVGLRGDSVAAAAMGIAEAAVVSDEPVETRVPYRPGLDFLVKLVLEVQSHDDVDAADAAERRTAAAEHDT